MSSSPAIDSPKVVWWRQLTGYHWFVFLVASAAWFFDCLDQRIFSLARNPALDALKNDKSWIHMPSADFAKVVTAFFLIGWGIGGMIFGSLGDKFGRAKMLTVTILIYSAFTGLSFFSHNWYDFTIFRFLTGVGVGGVFGLAVALIAETVPSGARAQTLGLLQVLSTIGNVSAGFAKMGIDALEKANVVQSGEGWRWMFLIGAVPALMVIFTGKYLKEPESWLRLKESGRLPKGGILAPYGKLVADSRWRRNLVIGALIASTGVVGLWAIGEYAIELQSRVFKSYYTANIPANTADPAKWVKDSTEFTKTIVYLLNMAGAATGMWIFTRVAGAFGRRLAFLVGFSASLVVTVFAYWKMNTPTDAYWMMFLMGAAQLGPFAGFAIYLPELFPSSLRSTGTSFCYNLGRFAAAAGSFFSAYLSTAIAGALKVDNKVSALPLRYSAMIMCSIFLIGILTLPFAPETKGKPLPEDKVDPPPTPERGFETVGAATGNGQRVGV